MHAVAERDTRRASGRSGHGLGRRPRSSRRWPMMIARWSKVIAAGTLALLLGTELTGCNKLKPPKGGGKVSFNNESAPTRETEPGTYAAAYDPELNKPTIVQAPA